MKYKYLLLAVCCIFIGCSNKRDIDEIVSYKWEQDKNDLISLIDFSNLMWFEWDTLCFYSGANSLEEINKDLGFELKEFTDVGDRVIFLNQGIVVYQKEWFPKSSEPAEGIIFLTDLKKFRLKKSDAKFIINKDGKVFYLKMLSETIKQKR